MSEGKYITVQEAGRRGGTKTRQRHGRAHFERAGKLGGRKVVEKYGREHFERVGRLGGQKVKELIALGKQTLAERETEEKPAEPSGASTGS